MQDTLIFTDEYAHERASHLKGLRRTRIACYWYGGFFLALALLCIIIMCVVGYDEGGAIAGWVFGINGSIFVGLGLLSRRSPRISFWLGIVASVLFLAGEIIALTSPDAFEVRLVLVAFAALQVTFTTFLARGIVFAGRLSNLPVVVAV